MSDETRKPRPVLIGEHDYARAPRFTWPGEVVFGAGERQHVVPGTWQLEFAPRALVRAGGADDVPSLRDAEAWHDRMSQIMTLQEPGAQLRIGTMSNGAWRTLEVTVPSRPPMLVEFDRAALVQVVGAERVQLRLRDSWAWR